MCTILVERVICPVLPLFMSSGDDERALFLFKDLSDLTDFSCEGERDLDLLDGVPVFNFCKGDRDLDLREMEGSGSDG